MLPAPRPRLNLPLARKFQITVVLLVAVMLVAAVGAYAWDSSRSDEIAEGVTIGGVDVGGMTAEEATGKVDDALVDPLRKPVTATYDGVKYQLSAERLEVRSDVDGMVDRALEESREGGLPTRVWRYATGGEVDVAIAPQISYSGSAIHEFVDKVAAEVNRPAVNASIEASSTSLNAVAGQDGLAVDQDSLRAKLESAVQSPAKRHVSVPVEAVEPEVTRDELAAQYPIYLTVDQSSFELTLWRDLKPVQTYQVAVGLPKYPTPNGSYVIGSKQVDPVWSVPNSPWAGELAGTTVAGGSAENPLKARWMGITDGVGIHGTDAVESLGTRASHGCIRMSVPDVIELYDQVPVGAPIYIGV